MDHRIVLCLSFALASSANVGADDWPQWRGPEGQGHAPTATLPLTWSETEHVTWKQPLPGRGWSSPVMMEGQIWLTTAYEKEASAEEAARRLETNTGDQPLTLLEEVRLHALCLDQGTGKLLHNIELIVEKNPQWVHKLNSYASPTPVLEPGRLYAHFGTFGTACVDTRTGQVLWRNTSLRIMHENGPGSSPILWGDHVIFHCDGSDEQYIVALNKQTGRVAWQTERSGQMRDNVQMKKAYGTPLVLERPGGGQELISPAADWLYAYDPATGRELWKLNYGMLGFSNVPRPVAGHGMIYISTGFMRPHMLGIRYDSAADPEIVWDYARGVPTMPSPLLVGNELYFISDSGGLVTCLNALTGEEIYRERLGGNHIAAPLYAAGRLYFFAKEGITTVLKSGPTFQVLAENKVEGQIQSSPAAVDGAIFLRTDRALYRIEDSSQPGP